MNDGHHHQTSFTLVLGGAIFLAGVLLNLEMFLSGAWPTSLFFIMMAVGPMVIGLGVWGRRNWVFRDRPLPYVKRNIGFVSVAVLVLLALIYATNVDVERHESFEMTWSYEEGSAQNPQARHIILRFVDYPNHYVGIWSSDLGNYLEKLPSNRVRVVFQVTRDFGKVRGFQEIQIGDLKGWHSSGGHAGRTGDASAPSPWD